MSEDLVRLRFIKSARNPGYTVPILVKYTYHNCEQYVVKTNLVFQTTHKHISVWVHVNT